MTAIANVAGTCAKQFMPHLRGSRTTVRRTIHGA